jgi:hypothetical protein
MSMCASISASVEISRMSTLSVVGAAGHAYKGTTGIVGHEGTTTYYRGTAIPDEGRPMTAV